MIRVLYYALTYLTAIGLNPLKQNTIAKILNVICFFLGSTTVIANYAEIIVNWKGLDSVEDMKYLAITTMALLKFLALYLKMSTLQTAIKKLDEFWTWDKYGRSHQKKLDSIHNKVVSFFKLYFVASITVCPFISAQPFIEGKRALVFPSVQVCDLNTDYCYITLYAWNVVSFMWPLVTAAIGFDILFAALVTYGYTGIEMVKIGFKELVVELHGGEMGNEGDFHSLVDQHAHVMSFIKDLNSLYSVILLTQFWSTLGSLILCYTMALSSPLNLNNMIVYLTLAGALIYQLSLYCISGTLIIEQTLSVSDEVYNVDWYIKTQPDFRRGLSMVIMRSQRVAKLTIGELMDLNLISFVSVLKNSVQIYGLIRSLSSTDKSNDNMIL